MAEKTNLGDLSVKFTIDTNTGEIKKVEKVVNDVTKNVTKDFNVATKAQEKFYKAENLQRYLGYSKNIISAGEKSISVIGQAYEQSAGVIDKVLEQTGRITDFSKTFGVSTKGIQQIDWLFKSLGSRDSQALSQGVLGAISGQLGDVKAGIAPLSMGMAKAGVSTTDNTARALNKIISYIKGAQTAELSYSRARQIFGADIANSLMPVIGRTDIKGINKIISSAPKYSDKELEKSSDLYTSKNQIKQLADMRVGKETLKDKTTSYNILKKQNNLEAAEQIIKYEKGQDVDVVGGILSQMMDVFKKDTKTGYGILNMKHAADDIGGIVKNNSGKLKNAGSVSLVADFLNTLGFSVTDSIASIMNLGVEISKLGNLQKVSDS